MTACTSLWLVAGVACGAALVGGLFVLGAAIALVLAVKGFLASRGRGGA